MLTVTATVNITPPSVTTTGTLTIDTDDRMPTYQAGTLEMSDGTKAAWGKSGAGTVTLSDGTVVTVANFDKGE